MKRSISGLIALWWLLPVAPGLASVIVEDGFDGAAGAAPDAARFEWGGEVTQNGTGQLSFQTWTANQSWLRSKAGAAPSPGQPLVLQLRAYAYAEDWTPGVYGDQQPRGLRAGADANNAIEFYSLSRTSVGMRVRKDGVESLAVYELPSGVDAMHDYEISVTTTAVTFKVDAALAGTFTANIPTGVFNVYASTADGGAGNVPVTIDSLSLSLADSPDFEYYTNSLDGTITIERYIGSGGVVTIPSTAYGQPVTAIGMNAFYGRTSLTAVTIPDSVTSIGNTAFIDCTSLTSATLGSGVTKIGYHAFFGCSSLATIAVNESNPAFSSVDGILFDNAQHVLLLYPAAKTGSYTVPGTVATIGNGAFDHCLGLTGVTIHESVTTIENGAFYSCTALAAVEIGQNVASIGSGAFYNCTSLGNVTIPNSVTSIGGAFSDCTGLTSVTLGSSLTNIAGAFVRCSKLPSVAIPASVTDIGDMAFAGCSSLAQVAIPNGVTRIGDSAFSACGNLTSLALPNSVASIGQYAFDYCTGLVGLTLPNRLTDIGRYAFKDCHSLTSMVIPDSVITIGWAAFNYCTSLKNVAIGKNVATIEDWAFSRCSSLTSISVDALNPFLSSRDGVLFDKAQTTLLKYPEGKAGGYRVPNTVTNIANYSFQDNAALTSVTIPASVARIGSQAFASCPNLTAVYFEGNAPAIDSSTFVNVNNLTVYYMPGTTGWESTLAGKPTVRWNPQALTGDATFGVRDGVFGFTITGSPDLVVVVEACAEPGGPAWNPVSTNTLTGGTSYFSDLQWTNTPVRFYRVRSP